MASFLAMAVGVFIASRMTRWYLRRFRAVWWQGYIIGLPSLFIGSMPIHGVDSPEWAQSTTVLLVLSAIVITYGSVKRDQVQGASPPN